MYNPAMSAHTIAGAYASILLLVLIAIMLLWVAFSVVQAIRSALAKQNIEEDDEPLTLEIIQVEDKEYLSCEDCIFTNPPSYLQCKAPAALRRDNPCTRIHGDGVTKHWELTEESKEILRKSMAEEYDG